MDDQKYYHFLVRETLCIYRQWYARSLTRPVKPAFDQAVKNLKRNWGVEVDIKRKTYNYLRREVMDALYEQASISVS